MNASGSSPAQLTTDPQDAFSAWPDWSPDGARIAFESNRDTLTRNNFANGAEVYVMNADGTLPVRLTHDAASDERPSWAPDGTAIAYSHVTLAVNGTLTGVQVFAMQAGGGNQHQLEANATEPDWQAVERDADGDGLPDDWETHGVDTDGDGHVDLDLPALSADPQRKDVFVEIDPMPGDELAQAAIADVVAAFAAAPVGNPDGTTGIDVHVDNGAGSVMNPRTGEQWGARSEQDAIPSEAQLGANDAGGDYEWAAFDALRAQHLSAAREPAFHYVIAADTFDADHHSGLSRGTPASDFLVSLGPICHPKGAACTHSARRRGRSCTSSGTTSACATAAETA
jgi:dipeptidyl aminopeptidase/acylaminoacyl peptidase